jgi:glycosyltransferase involved in cell wall biosynthesis
MTDGGHMVIARELAQALRDAGHAAEIIVTPQNRFGRQGSAYLATWLTDVGRSEGHRIDQVISLRYPSYAVRHERHVCWLNHTMREYYDLWDRFSGTLSPQGLVKEKIRRAAIHAADRYLLTRNVRKLYVQSRTVQERLNMWPNLRSEVLYPPAPRRPYRCERYGEYFFMVSRLTKLKRGELLIAALAAPEGAGLRVVIAGDGEERPHLEAAVDRYGLRDRVNFAGRLTDDAVLEHYARCRAVIFPPLQEDYGFVTAEAFASRKPVVTCTDSGGPAELVVDGVSGFITQPTPEALAHALRTLADDDGLAERMGQSAFAAGARLNWPDTVATLTR